MTAAEVEEHYRQVISLAVCGLYNDDIEVIKHTFGITTVLRKDTSASFKELKSKGTPKKTSLWAVKNVCKMATASQSKWGVNQEHHIVPSFRLQNVGVWYPKDV